MSENGDWGATGAATISVSGASTTYTITTSDDQVDEADGSVTATVEAGTGYTVGSASSASVNVADNDLGPGNSGTLTVSIENPGPDESVGRGEVLKLTVTASETAEQDVTIPYDAQGFSLVATLDFCIIASDEEIAEDFSCFDIPHDDRTSSGEVTIAEGEDSTTIDIWIDSEAWVSASSRVMVSLTGVEGAKEVTARYADIRVTE